MNERSCDPFEDIMIKMNVFVQLVLKCDSGCSLVIARRIFPHVSALHTSTSLSSNSTNLVLSPTEFSPLLLPNEYVDSAEAALWTSKQQIPICAVTKRPYLGVMSINEDNDIIVLSLCHSLADGGALSFYTEIAGSDTYETRNVEESQKLSISQFDTFSKEISVADNEEKALSTATMCMESVEGQSKEGTVKFVVGTMDLPSIPVRSSHGITVNDMITTSLVIAVERHNRRVGVSWDSPLVGVNVCVNTRKYVGDELLKRRELLGNYVATVRPRIQSFEGEEGKLINIAKRIHSTVNELCNNGHLFNHLREMSVPHEKEEVQPIGKSVEISNIGVVKVSGDVESVYISLTMGVDCGCISLLVYTVNNVIYMNLYYGVSVLSDDDAKQLRDDIVSVITRWKDNPNLSFRNVLNE